MWKLLANLMLTGAYLPWYVLQPLRLTQFLIDSCFFLPHVYCETVYTCFCVLDRECFLSTCFTLFCIVMFHHVLSHYTISLRVLLLLSLQRLRDFFSVGGEQVMALIMYINWLLPQPLRGHQKKNNSLSLLLSKRPNEIFSLSFSLTVNT